jgi:hypothetical protein
MPAADALPVRLLRFLAWILLLGIVFSTLSPIGLRPESGLPANDERFAAFLVLSLVFTLAYPHRLLRVVLIVAAVAIILEALQLVIPSRDARLHDLIVKLVGGGLGAGLGVLVLGWLRRRAVGPPAGKAPSPGLLRNPTSPQGRGEAEARPCPGDTSPLGERSPRSGG